MPKVNPKILSSETKKANNEVRELRLTLGIEKDTLKNIIERKKRFERENIDLEQKNEQLKKSYEENMARRAVLSQELQSLKQKNDELDKKLGFRVMDVESKENENRKQADENKRKAVEVAKEDDRVKALAQEVDLKWKSLDDKEKMAVAEQESAQSLSREVTKRLNALEIDEIKFQRKLERIRELEEALRVKITEAEREKEILAGKIKQQENKIKDVEKEEAEVVKTRAKFNIAIDETNVEKAEMIRRQHSLTANIRELKNEENRIELFRLRVIKLINDNKDIKELEALRKELLMDKLTLSTDKATKET